MSDGEVSRVVSLVEGVGPGYDAAKAQQDEMISEAYGGATSSTSCRSFVAPVFLGDGIRIFDVSGGRRIDWELVEIYDASPRSQPA